MTPAARIQAAIELLERMAAPGAGPADQAMGDYFRARRYIGSGDRRAVSEQVYGILRRRARLDWWIGRAAPAPVNPVARLRVIAELALLRKGDPEALFSGGQFAPAHLNRFEKALVAALRDKTLDHPDMPEAVRLEIPAWIEPELRAVFGEALPEEMAGLNGAAPLDLRVNALKADRPTALAALKADGVEAEPTRWSPLGIRAPNRVALGNVQSFRDGVVEVQDEGSQIVSLLVDARPGARVVDFCAGAGGKALAMAAGMGNKGHIVACDVSQGRLDRAAERLRRAGAHNVERRLLADERDPWVKRHRESFDRVLIDAPCSGTGTWRRNPDARWRIGPQDLTELVAVQRRILDSACRLVKPGGRLVYVTCSVLPAENEAQAAWFSEAHPEFAPVPVAEAWAETIRTAPPEDIGPEGMGAVLRLTPARHGTDGFFAALFERRP